MGSELSEARARFRTPRKAPLAGRGAQAGMALVVVLWVTTLLLVMAASFSVGVRRDASAARNVAAALEAEAAAVAGLRLAMIGLAQPAEPQRWRPGDGDHTLSWEGVTLRITVGSEAGRVDLNHADARLLNSALTAGGVRDAHRRAAIVAQILDWRDLDDLRRQNGLALADYRRLGLPYGPANGPFQAVEELMLLPGVTPQIYRRLRHLVTVHSSRPGISLDHAPDGLRRALGADGSAPAPGAGDSSARGTAGTPLSVRAVATLQSGAERSVRAVLQRRHRGDPEPYRIVHYRHERQPGQ